MAAYRIRTYLSESTFIVEKRYWFFFWGYCKITNDLSEAKKFVDDGVDFYRTHKRKTLFKK